MMRRILIGSVLATVLFTSPTEAATTCGGVDDTATLQAAINRGGNVLLAPGTCVITGTLYYGANTNIQGAGTLATTIRNAASRNGAPMLVPKAFGQYNDKIQFLTLDANTSSMTNDFTLDLSGTHYALVYHVFFEHIQQVAIYADTRRSPAAAVDHLYILYNTVWDSYGDGISFFGVLTNTFIDHNEVAGCRDDAIAMQYEAGVGMPDTFSISYNYIHDCWFGNDWGSLPNGIHNYGGRNATITGNVIKNIGSNGILNGDALGVRPVNATITGNYVEHSGLLLEANPASAVSPYGYKIENADNVSGGESNTVNTTFTWAESGNTNLHGFASVGGLP